MKLKLKNSDIQEVVEFIQIWFFIPFEQQDW